MSSQLGRLCLALLSAACIVIHPVLAVRGMNEPPPRITPAGRLVIDQTTRLPAVGALPTTFLRSPDTTGPDGKGRFLICLNSGYGVLFASGGNRGQQSISVLDLAAKPAPAVVQNVYFPSPQSANVGAVFAPRPDAGGNFDLYVSGGFENKVWVFSFNPKRTLPLAPTSPGPDTKVAAPFVDLAGLTGQAPSQTYNAGQSPVYPVGIDLLDDTLFTANNLGDSLGIVADVRGEKTLERIPLATAGVAGNIYPYGVIALPRKVYVSCWGTGTVAVVDRATKSVKHVPVERHPTAMCLNAEKTRLFVVNSNADSVSVIDTADDRVVERIDTRLAEKARIGGSPEGVCLSPDGKRLYVANAHANALAVVTLGEIARGDETESKGKSADPDDRSRVAGFIPTGFYPSAVAIVGTTLFIGNGKGTGFENSSVVATTSGLAPNTANDRFPNIPGRSGNRPGGEYSVNLISGTISAVPVPTDRELAGYTQQVMRNLGLLGTTDRKLFRGASPIKHVIYVIKENRTYDQVFGDIEKSGDGRTADGDATLAVFGNGEAAIATLANGQRTGPQTVTPNHRALVRRFGLLDRFFANSEASPDGHNWSTAAFSSDYTDKAYRWNYSGRGRTYDFEGFNRLPSGEAPTAFPVTADQYAAFFRRYIPYLNGGRDIAEPETLYLWDLAARSGLSYRIYGEFIGTVTENDLAAANRRQPKRYPDLSPVIRAVPTKKSLENHFCPTYRNYDLSSPDIMTVESYQAARATGGEAAIAADHPDPKFRGATRYTEWLAEFQRFAAEREAGKGDPLPNLSIVRLSNDHTRGYAANNPTPQFYVADNDYALGKMVETVSKSAYWKDTAIFVVEDDAQDGADHVDCHRCVALVISAYNRPGALVHEFHNTVSLIRTMELVLGLPPMNLLDEAAVPIDIFQDKPDLTPYTALLPDLAADNLLVTVGRGNSEAAYFQRLTERQDLAHADMANPAALNEIIWFSVKGRGVRPPEVARLPAFDAMRLGLPDEEEEEEREGREALAER